MDGAAQHPVAPAEALERVKRERNLSWNAMARMLADDPTDLRQVSRWLRDIHRIRSRYGGVREPNATRYEQRLGLPPGSITRYARRGSRVSPTVDALQRVDERLRLIEQRLEALHEQLNRLGRAP
jgi:hypothetical protein